MVNMTKTSQELIQTPDKKGVPGFSQRLNILFDKAGAPIETRLTWGSKRWQVAPNTVRNWIRLDIPPQSFATLENVVSDLLNQSISKTDKSSVIGWLYAGGKNPFDKKEEASVSDQQPINHMLQFQIYNALFKACQDKGIDLNNADPEKVYQIILAIYLHLETQRASGLSINIIDAMPIFANLIKAL